MRFLSDPSLPGHGIISGVFANRDGSIMAVASSFQLLVNPPARASYSGQHLRHRVALYRPPETKPFAVFDELRFPVNDVAFHPFEPTAAIATGSYDGGFLFEGELVVWDWMDGRYTTKIGPIPEVVRTAFCNDGSCVVAMVRPWNENLEEENAESFHSFYEVRATYSEDLFDGVFNEDSINLQMSRQTPLSDGAVAADSRFPPIEQDVETAIRHAFGLGAVKRRSAIWDAAWLDNGDIAIAHDGCQLEVLTPEGASRQRFTGGSHGVELLKHAGLLIHAVQSNPEAQDWAETYSTQLLRYDGKGLSEAARFIGAFTFSISGDGWILGRRNRIGLAEIGKLDVIGGPGLDAWTRCDIGHYDVFNHFLRIDGAPNLFAVQGTPPGSHERKQVCMLDHEGHAKPLWPIAQSTGQQQDHAMECAFAYVSDSVGEGIVAAGRYFDPNPSRSYDGFICRRRLHDGKELWRHAPKAGATTIKQVPGTGIILAAFLNGEFAAIDSASGDVLQWTEFRPDGIPSVVFSFDVTQRDVVLGTFDGRVCTLPVADFLRSGFG